MRKDFQVGGAYNREFERRRQLWMRCRLDWLRYVQQNQLANFALTFAVVISVGVAIGFILQP
jgi:hypothetical protein